MVLKRNVLAWLEAFLRVVLCLGEVRQEFTLYLDTINHTTFPYQPKRRECSSPSLCQTLVSIQWPYTRIIQWIADPSGFLVHPYFPLWYWRRLLWFIENFSWILIWEHSLSTERCFILPSTCFTSQIASFIQNLLD